MATARLRRGMVSVAALALMAALATSNLALMPPGTAIALGASTAWAASPAPSSSGSDSAPRTPGNAVTLGVCTALGQLQHGIDARGREVQDEKALEHARRTDAVAEQLRLEALNDRGAEYHAATEAAAAAAAEEARAAQQAAERAAAEAKAEAIPADATPTANEAVPTAPAPLTSTIYFHGHYIPFVQGNPADVTAPRSNVASTWIGGGDVDDGMNTYFIGHNPGVFSSVMNLQIGDEIVVWDDSGSSRSYFVFDALVLPNASNYFAYESRLSPSGESITLQTCVADDRNVRCVMAR